MCTCAMPDVSVTSLCINKKPDTCVHKHMKLNGVLVEKPLGTLSNSDLCLNTKGNLIKNEGSDLSLFEEL